MLYFISHNLYIYNLTSFDINFSNISHSSVKQLLFLAIILYQQNYIKRNEAFVDADENRCQGYIFFLLEQTKIGSEN